MTSSVSDDRVVRIPNVSNRLAHAIAARAEEHAESIGVPSVIAIVDASGVLKYFSRMDGAGLAPVQVAKDKAYSASATATPTGAWYDLAQQDPALGFGLPGIERLSTLAGGVPITVDGVVVGGLGVSGGSASQDAAVANAGMEVVSA